MELNEDNALEEMNLVVAALHSKSLDTGNGRGVVICGGGIKYFTCAWVCINMLRRLGCTLPIELWHLGPREMPGELSQLVGPLDVRCVDAYAVRETSPARILNGWELKPYSIVHSRFREVLVLDADNVPIVDPTFLFDTPEYRRSGALFWPDFGRLGRDRMVWRLCGVAYRDEPEFESGQILVDKGRHWDALALTMWMNEHSDFWYRHVHGDKETYHIAWRKLGRAYEMPRRGIQALAGTMCQHDFDGRRIFQHRNLRKWTLNSNAPVPGFEFEHVCLQFIEQLDPHRRSLYGFPGFDAELSAELAGKMVDYHRVGHDRRPMSFEADGSIDLGRERMEQFWGVRRERGLTVLEIYGDDGVTARLVQSPADLSEWNGYWVIHERMPVQVRVTPPESEPTHSAAQDVGGVGPSQDVFKATAAPAT